MFCKRVPSVAYAWTKRAPIVTKRFISATSFKMANANFTQGAGLDRFVKVDLLQKETPQKIQSIWVQHHHKLPCISAVLQKEQYQKLKDKAAKWFLFKRILLKCTALYLFFHFQEAKLDLHPFIAKCFQKLTDVCFPH